MKGLNEKIEEYLMRLDPRILGLGHSAEFVSVKKIGLGESNLNYLANIDGENFVVRINMHPAAADKSRKEFDNLKAVEHLGIAPKVYHLETSKEYLGETFIILKYLRGKTLGAYKKIDYEIVEKLGSTIAKLHNTNIDHLKETLPKHGSSRTELLQGIEKRIEYIRAKREMRLQQDRVLTLLFENPYDSLRRSSLREQPFYVLGHGDIDPQNVVVYRGDLKLIDWEDLGLIDPALEIAGAFDAFDFPESQREMFLNGYLAEREDHDLAERIANFMPFQIFRVFCWSVMHVYEIAQREMHEAFLKEQKLKKHIAYAEKMFNKCKNARIMNKDAKWDIQAVFPDLEV